MIDHELYRLMRDARLGERETHTFLAGIWPVIEQFPQYMAMNLVKVQYGRTQGHDMARRYLIRNIRVEQSHADHWIEWAEASGVSKEDLITGQVPMASHVLSHWCWHTCERDSLAAAMAATNYAIEGATGEWSMVVCSSDTYENSFDPQVRRKAMKWLRMHAEYDDKHPWEALEIICTIMGLDPTSRGIALLRSCILKSYDYMRITLDYVEQFRLHPMSVIVLICVIYVLLGTAMEELSMILLTVPVLFPLVVHLGFDPLWFGVLVVVVVEIGLISPPVGMNIFVLRTLLPNVSTGTIYRGVTPFVIADIVRLIILISLPILSTWLPHLLF